MPPPVLPYASPDDKPAPQFAPRAKAIGAMLVSVVFLSVGLALLVGGVRLIVEPSQPRSSEEEAGFAILLVGAALLITSVRSLIAVIFRD